MLIVKTLLLGAVWLTWLSVVEFGDFTIGDENSLGSYNFFTICSLIGLADCCSPMVGASILEVDGLLMIESSPLVRKVLSLALVTLRSLN